MNALVTISLALAAMAVVVIGFRLWVRPPRGRSEWDPPQVRTVVVFSGDDPRFFSDDRPGGMFVGRYLFKMLCGGLAERGVQIENIGTIPYAHRAECVLEGERFALVFERHELRWVAGVEWVPESAAVRRHMALTHRIYSPPDTRALRHLLSALAEWLHSQPTLTEIQWHRKERWLLEDVSDPDDTPVR
jgi:hypothetical protein